MTYDRSSFGESDCEPGTKILERFVDDRTKEGAWCCSMPAVIHCHVLLFLVTPGSGSCIRMS